jgi:hypothetical protein
MPPADDPYAEANAGEVLRAIWPTMAGLFFSGTCGLLIFPFLTYVPSDGMLGELLPKVGQGTWVPWLLQAALFYPAV